MRFLFATMALLGVTALGNVGARRAVAAEPMKSQWDGVYSLEQAKRGEPLYLDNCAACHGSDLTGGEMAPSLIGFEFSANWDGLTRGDIFERIRISMPQNDPSALTRAQKIDVLRPVVAPAPAPLHRLDLREAGLPEAQHVLRQLQLLRNFADRAERVGSLDGRGLCHATRPLPPTSRSRRGRR